jgi:undecaprenyl-diphosphatase
MLRQSRPGSRIPRTMNGTDLYLLGLFNGFAHRSSTFDASVVFLADQPMVKSGLLGSLLWVAWFRRDHSQKLHRELVISTLVATIASLIFVKIVRSLLPFRLRPIHDLASGFTLPYHVTTETLWNWSSFPSDTAAMVFALAGGLAIIWRRWGWLALVYSLVVVSFPRIYLGYHYPSDVAAGAVIGVLSVFILGREKIRRPLTRRVLTWSERYPGVFYWALFLLTCEVAAGFDNTRQTIIALGKLFRS